MLQCLDYYYYLFISIDKITNYVAKTVCTFMSTNIKGTLMHV